MSGVRKPYKPTKIVVIDSSPDIKELAGIVSNTALQQEKVLQLRKKSLIPFVRDNSPNPFDVFKEQDLAASVWVGHSGTGIFGKPAFVGDYHPGDFVDRFDEEFNKKFVGLKDKVVDIFLVGCEAGLVDENGRSLAQEIADHFYSKGFINAVVHTVANPPISQYVNMRVSVVTAGLTEVGCVSSYLLTRAQDKTLSDLDDQYRKNEQEAIKTEALRQEKIHKKESAKEELKTLKALDEIRKTLKKQIDAIQEEAVSFLDVDPQDIIEELRRPHNTFHPQVKMKTNPQLRRPSKELTQELVLNEINKRIRQERRKGKANDTLAKIEILETLRLAISNNTNETWGQPIDAAMDAIERKFTAGYAHSTTYQLLSVLVTKARDKCGYQPKDRSGNVILSMAKTAKTVVGTIEEAINKKIDQFGSIAGKKKKIIATLFSELRPSPKKVELKMPLEMAKTIEMVTAFIAELNKEEANRPAKWLNDLFPLKSHKKERLQQLINDIHAYYETNKGYQPEEDGVDLNQVATKQLAGWLDLVREAQKDKALVKSRFSHRTENLINNILSGQPGRGILGPKDMIGDWVPAPVNTITRRI